MPTMIPEKQAAEKVNCSPLCLREKAKSGAWNIHYNSRNGRNYHYSLTDINKLVNNPEQVITGIPDRWQRRRAKLQHKEGSSEA